MCAIKLSIPEFTERLANAGVKSYEDQNPWSTHDRNILSNELCIGQMMYNLTTTRLQSRKVRNPEQLWTGFSAFEPIVPVPTISKGSKSVFLGINIGTKSDNGFL